MNVCTGKEGFRTGGTQSRSHWYPGAPLQRLARPLVAPGLIRPLQTSRIPQFDQPQLAPVAVRAAADADAPKELDPLETWVTLRQCLDATIPQTRTVFVENNVNVALLAGFACHC
jgi:hypothetical protein